MGMIVSKPRQDVQAWLVISRPAGLPTVWSNVLVAWLLGGGGSASRLIGLLWGASLVYLGGVLLNDYFDIEYDRHRQPARPLPSGRLQPRLVRRIGAGGLILGTVLLMWAGTAPVLTLFLLGAALLYNALHTATKLSPVIMGSCRLLLYLVSASAATDGVTGFVLWSAIALAMYVGGLTYIAHTELARRPAAWWPLPLLGTPVLLALIANRGEYRDPAVRLSLVLALWVVPCLRHALREGGANRQLTVSGLAAGIVLVDLLATSGESPRMILLFGFLFVATIALQRYLPAS